MSTYWNDVPTFTADLLKRELRFVTPEDLLKTDMLRHVPDLDASRSLHDDIVDEFARTLMIAEKPSSFKGKLETYVQSKLTPVLQTLLADDLEVYDTSSIPMQDNFSSDLGDDKKTIKPDYVVMRKRADGAKWEPRTPADIHWRTVAVPFELKTILSDSSKSQDEGEVVKQLLKVWKNQSGKRLGALAARGVFLKGSEVVLYRLRVKNSGLVVEECHLSLCKSSRTSTVETMLRFVFDAAQAQLLSGFGDGKSVLRGPALGRGSTSTVFATLSPQSEIVDPAWVVKIAHSQSACREELLREMNILKTLAAETNVVSCANTRTDVEPVALLLQALTPFVSRDAVRFSTFQKFHLDNLLDGLFSMHAKRLVHRDVAPWNLGFDDRDRAIIFDLGSAQELDRETLQYRSDVYNGTRVTAPLHILEELATTLTSPRSPAPDFVARPSDDIESLALSVLVVNEGKFPNIPATTKEEKVFLLILEHWRQQESKWLSDVRGAAKALDEARRSQPDTVASKTTELKQIFADAIWPWSKLQPGSMYETPPKGAEG